MNRRTFLKMVAMLPMALVLKPKRGLTDADVEMADKRMLEEGHRLSDGVVIGRASEAAKEQLDWDRLDKLLADHALVDANEHGTWVVLVGDSGWHWAKRRNDSYESVI